MSACCSSSRLKQPELDVCNVSAVRWAESHDPNKLDATISFKVYITEDLMAVKIRDRREESLDITRNEAIDTISSYRDRADHSGPPRFSCQDERIKCLPRESRRNHTFFLSLES